MSTRQAADESPAVVIAKTEASAHARNDKVSLMETDDYVCLEPSDPLSKAVEVMKQDEGGCAIVCDQGRVVGIFTERDVLIKVIGESVDMNDPVTRDVTLVATLVAGCHECDAGAMMTEKSFEIFLVRDVQLEVRSRFR